MVLSVVKLCAVIFIAIDCVGTGLALIPPETSNGAVAVPCDIVLNGDSVAEEEERAAVVFCSCGS